MELHRVGKLVDLLGFLAFFVCAMAATSKATVTNCDHTALGYELVKEGFFGEADVPVSDVPSCLAYDGTTLRHGYTVRYGNESSCCLEKGMLQTQTGICATGCDMSVLTQTDFFYSSVYCYKRCFDVLTDVCISAPLSNSVPAYRSGVHSLIVPAVLAHSVKKEYAIITAVGLLSAYSLGPLDADLGSPEALCTGRGQIVTATDGTFVCECNRCGDVRFLGFVFSTPVTAGTVCFFDCFTSVPNCVLFTGDAPTEVNVLGSIHSDTCGSCYRQCLTADNCTSYRYMNLAVAAATENVCGSLDALHNTCTLETAADSKVLLDSSDPSCLDCHKACEELDGCLSFTYNTHSVGFPSGKTLCDTTNCLMTSAENVTVSAVVSSCSECYRLCQNANDCLTWKFSVAGDASAPYWSWSLNVCEGITPSGCLLLDSSNSIAGYGHGIAEVSCLACDAECMRLGTLCEYFQYQDAIAARKGTNSCTAVSPPQSTCVLLTSFGVVLSSEMVYTCYNCYMMCLGNAECQKYNFDDVGNIDIVALGQMPCTVYPCELYTATLKVSTPPLITTCEKCQDYCRQDDQCLLYASGAGVLAYRTVDVCQIGTVSSPLCVLYDNNLIALTDAFTVPSCTECYQVCSAAALCSGYEFDHRGIVPHQYDCSGLSASNDSVCLTYSAPHNAWPQDFTGSTSVCYGCASLCDASNCTVFTFGTNSLVSNTHSTCAQGNCMMFDKDLQMFQQIVTTTCGDCLNACIVSPSCDGYFFGSSTQIIGTNASSFIVADTSFNMCPDGGAHSGQLCTLYTVDQLPYLVSYLATCSACYQRCSTSRPCYFYSVGAVNESDLVQFDVNSCQLYHNTCLWLSTAGEPVAVDEAIGGSSCSACASACFNSSDCYAYQYNSGNVTLSPIDMCTSINCWLFNSDFEQLMDLPGVSCNSCYQACRDMSQCEFYRVSDIALSVIPWTVDCTQARALEQASRPCRLISSGLEPATNMTIRVRSCSACSKACSDLGPACLGYVYSDSEFAMNGYDVCADLLCNFRTFLGVQFADVAAIDCEACYENCHADPDCYYYQFTANDPSYWEVDMCLVVDGCVLLNGTDIVSTDATINSCLECGRWCDSDASCVEFMFHGIYGSAQDQPCDQINCQLFDETMALVTELQTDCNTCFNWCYYDAQCQFYAAGDGSLARWVTETCPLPNTCTLDIVYLNEPYELVVDIQPGPGKCNDCAEQCTLYEPFCSSFTFNSLSVPIDSDQSPARTCSITNCVLFDGNLQPQGDFYFENCSDCYSKCFEEGECIYYAFMERPAMAWQSNTCNGEHQTSTSLSCWLGSSSMETIIDTLAPTCDDCLALCDYHILCDVFTFNSGKPVNLADAYQDNFVCPVQ